VPVEHNGRRDQHNFIQDALTLRQKFVAKVDPTVHHQICELVGGVQRSYEPFDFALATRSRASDS